MSYVPTPPPIEFATTEKKPEDKTENSSSDVGTLGIGFDPSCGGIQPGINVGGGIQIGMDGHIGFKLF